MAGITEEARDEFEQLAKPLIKWLNDNLHPHSTVIVTPTTAEVLEGVACVSTNEFLRD